MTAQVLEAAQTYSRLGISTIPVNPLNHEKPKAPAVDSWKRFQLELPSERQLVKWFAKTKHRIAVLTGPGSRNLCVLDIDNLELAESIVADAKFMEGKVAVRTPRGGLHLYFRESRVSGNRHYTGVGDIRAKGGYVVAPPSQGYRWIRRGRIPRIDNLEDFAEHEVFPLFGIEGKDDGEERGHTLPDEVTEGGRNDTLFRLASFMRGKGMSPEAILAALLVENDDRCKPPLPEREVRLIAAQGAKYDPNEEREPTTDLGNARRLLGRHGRDLKYVGRTWYVWNGKYWQRDDTQKVGKLAIETVLSIPTEVSEDDTEEERQKLYRWAAASQGAARLDAMVSVAAKEATEDATLFDSDPWLLSVANGTLNLQTGELQPHKRSDLITRGVRTAYKPTAKAPNFERFLSQIIPDRETRTFLKRVLGYSLTGSTREQLLFILYGTGQNGKSTLVELVSNILGEYAAHMPPKFLMATRNESGSTELTILKGARFCITQESEAGGQLAESLLKLATGGDKITARRLYENSMTFEPTHKLFLITNHKPIVRGTDKGLWRRIRLIPFEVQIPDNKLDRDLPTKLKAEHEGVLRWLVEGCLEWQRDGLKLAGSVAKATNEYKTESDTFREFLEDHCRRAPDAVASASTLYNAYSSWAGSRNERAMSATSFGKKLREQGFAPTKDKQDRRAWRGLSLKSIRAR